MLRLDYKPHIMQPTNNFIRFAALCCFVSVITTLGIHLYFPEPPADFEQRAVLHRNTLYMVDRWWVIVHCLLVLIAMWGFALLQWKKAPGAAGLGFVFFVVFVVAEITRQMFVLFYMNELREQYGVVTDVNTKQNIRQLLTYAGLLTAPLFGLFIFVFALGNLCYGLSLWNEKGFGTFVRFLLIVWAVVGLTVLANQFLRVAAIDRIIEVFNYSFQPFIRTIIGIWLWRKATAL